MHVKFNNKGSPRVCVGEGGGEGSALECNNLYHPVYHSILGKTSGLAHCNVFN